MRRSGVNLNLVPRRTEDTDKVIRVRRPYVLLGAGPLWAVERELEPCLGKGWMGR